MKILHIITSLQTGGAEKLMVDLLPRLRDLGNEVELLLFDGTRTAFYNELEQADIKIHCLSISGNVYNPLNIFKLRKYLNRYDIIHTHNTACQLFVALNNLKRKRNVLTTEHSTNNRRRSWKWYKQIDRWMYSHYKKVICISDKAQNSLENYIGLNNHFCTINNGVDLSKYHNQILDISRCDEFIITMVAGFRHAKDQDTLIKAITRLPKNYKLWLIGDGERREDLERLIALLRVSERVKLWGSRNDIPDLLAQSHIIVLSSHWEGLSLSSIEGMTSGKPFVASDVDGLHDVVVGAGVLFPHKNYEALAHEIKSLCENPDKYRQVAQACQERAKQFDINIMAEKYNKLYKEIR